MGLSLHTHAHARWFSLVGLRPPGKHTEGNAGDLLTLYTKINPTRVSDFSVKVNNTAFKRKQKNIAVALEWAKGVS